MISRFFFLSSFHFFYCGGSAGHYHLPVLLRRAAERCSHCPVFRTCTHFFVFFYDSSSSSSSFKKFDIKIKTSKAHNKSRVGRYLLLLSSLSLFLSLRRAAAAAGNDGGRARALLTAVFQNGGQTNQRETWENAAKRVGEA